MTKENKAEGALIFFRHCIGLFLTQFMLIFFPGLKNPLEFMNFKIIKENILTFFTNPQHFSIVL